MRYEFDLARSFMKSTRNKKFYHPHIMLSILGIALGVGFLVFALSIYDGYVKKIETIIFSFYPQITLQSDNSGDDPEDGSNLLLLGDEEKDDNCGNVCRGQVILEDRTLTQVKNSAQTGFHLEYYDDLKRQLKPVREIKQISPIIFEEADFTYSFASSKGRVLMEGPLRILGVQAQKGTFAPEIQRTITDRGMLKTLEKLDAHYVILSAELYKKLFNESPAGQPQAGKKLHLRMKPVNGNYNTGTEMELIIAGVFKLGMHKISENMIITSLSTAQKIFSMEQQATFLGVSLHDPYRAEQIADDIKHLTAENEPPLHIYHWMAVAADLFNSLSFYRKIVIVVLFMSILITAFNIYTTLNIMILERKKQIGILVSMGMKKASLYRTFFIVSQVEALIGVISGIAAGVLLGYYFSDYFNRSLQAFLQISDAGTVVDWGTAVLILFFVSLLCGVTAVIATRKGANLDPVESLRSE